MILISDKIPHPFFSLYYFYYFLQIPNSDDKIKLAKYLIRLLEDKIFSLQENNSGAKLLDSYIQFLFYLKFFSYEQERDSDDTQMYYAPNFMQYYYDDETYTPQLLLTQKLIDESFLPTDTDAYIFENKILFGFNPSLCDGLIVYWNGKIDSILTLLSEYYITDMFHKVVSDEKEHREGTKKDKVKSNGVRPKILTLLTNHFHIMKGPKSRSTIHRHCEEIYNNIKNILDDVKYELIELNLSYYTPLKRFNYFFENRSRIKTRLGKRIDLNITEFIYSTS